MKPSSTAVRLSWLIIILALVAAGAGLSVRDEGGSFPFTTVRGDTVQVYGQGLYDYDTPLVAVGLKAADAVTLIVAIPLLALAAWLYRRGSFKGGLLLCGALAFFLYNYTSMAFGAAYNNFFLIYVALMWASLFALIPALLSFDLPALPAHFSPRLPRRGIGIFLIVSGIILMLVWLALSIIPALLEGRPPTEVSYYTTFTTAVIDMALVSPALLTAGILLLRRAPAGDLLSATMLVFTCILGAALFVGGIAQLRAGVMSAGQAVGFTAPFVILTLFALGFTIRLFRGVSEAAPAGPNPQKSI